MSDSIYWLSYHIFFKCKRDAFLLNTVIPLIQKIKNEIGVERFFYIRYNEGGRHIRLRFLCKKSKKTQLSQTIDVTCETYFSNKDFEIRETTYLPEVERYGGYTSLAIAEEHFTLSSEVCLAVLSEQNEDILSRALIMHFSMMAVSSLSQVKIQALCDSYIQNWFPHSGLSDSETTFSQTAFKYFEPEYQKMKQPELFKKIYDLVEARTETGIYWLDTWTKENTSILSRLLRAVVSQVEYQNIMQSLIHMTNNRLGVKNYNEAFLAYLLKRTIEDVLKPLSGTVRRP